MIDRDDTGWQDDLTDDDLDDEESSEDMARYENRRIDEQERR